MLNARKIGLCTVLALILGVGSFTVATIGLPTKAEAATCKTCKGTGNSQFKCTPCGGTGIAKGTKKVQCGHCKGTGWKRCSSCNGSGQK